MGEVHKEQGTERLYICIIKTYPPYFHTINDNAEPHGSALSHSCSLLDRQSLNHTLTQIGHWRLNRFCFIVEQIGCICNAGVAGYVKLQRQARCRQENKDVRKQRNSNNFWTLWSNDLGLNKQSRFKYPYILRYCSSRFISSLPSGM